MSDNYFFMIDYVRMNRLIPKKFLCSFSSKTPYSMSMLNLIAIGTFVGTALLVSMT